MKMSMKMRMRVKKGRRERLLVQVGVLGRRGMELRAVRRQQREQQQQQMVLQQVKEDSSKG